MTRKHFNALAVELSSVRPQLFFTPGSPEEAAYVAWRNCVNAVGHACRQANPNFNRDRFNTACGADLVCDEVAAFNARQKGGQS